MDYWIYSPRSTDNFTKAIRYKYTKRLQKSENICHRPYIISHQTNEKYTLIGTIQKRR